MIDLEILLWLMLYVTILPQTTLSLFLYLDWIMTGFPFLLNLDVLKEELAKVKLRDVSLTSDFSRNGEHIEIKGTIYLKFEFFTCVKN